MGHGVGTIGEKNLLYAGIVNVQILCKIPGGKRLVIIECMVFGMKAVTQSPQGEHRYISI